MSLVTCIVCGKSDFKYCYILSSNGIKHYRKVCVNCGQKQGQSIKKEHIQTLNLDYEPKEWTGKFYYQWMLKTVITELNLINELCPHCHKSNCLQWVVHVFAGGDQQNYRYKCKYCLNYLPIATGYYQVIDDIKSQNILNINSAKEEQHLIHKISFRHQIPIGLYQEYQEYLLSPEWQKKKNIRLSLDNGQCVLCFTTRNLQTHHVTYERLFNEEPRDLMTVCKDCHETIHGRKFE